MQGHTVLSYPKNEVLSKNVDSNFIPIDQNRYSESEGEGDLEKMIISGRLLKKFMNESVKFPEVPVAFKGFTDYVAIW
jgi:hypothetical protein